MSVEKQLRVRGLGLMLLALGAMTEVLEAVVSTVLDHMTGFMMWGFAISMFGLMFVGMPLGAPSDIDDVDVEEVAR